MELQIIQSKIYEIRGQRVMLDADLAELYQVETRVLNQAVKRNVKRFPEDFMFQLTKEETELSRSQFVTLNKRGSNIKYLPFAFTEHGITMLSSVLRSEKAIEMNIIIVRAFIAMRDYIIKNVPTNELNELKKRVELLEEDVESLNKDQEHLYKEFDDIYFALAQLAAKNDNKTPRKRIGFVQSDE